MTELNFGRVGKLPLVGGVVVSYSPLTCVLSSDSPPREWAWIRKPFLG